jgi:hypothetical protein
MSAWQSPDPLELKMETLKAQQGHLLLLREHHLRWMNDTDNPEIGRKHGDMVNLLRQAEDQIQSLLDVLQAQLDKE